MYEGAPNWPAFDRFWAIVEKHKVNILYTAPTAIRTFIKWGDEWPKKHDLSSLRLLGTVGEPINPEAWMWYREVIGGGRCPIVDTWWQTETSAIMISPVPGAVATTPGSATKPFPSIEAEVVTRAGERVPLGSGGFLVIKRPWPWMLLLFTETLIVTFSSTGPIFRVCTSRAMAHAKMRTATSGSWGASMTC